MSAALATPRWRLAGAPTGRTGRFARDLLIAVAVIAGWQLLAVGPLAGEHLLAAPTGIISAISQHTELYWNALTATLAEAAQGFLWGNLIALLLASLIAVLPVLERLVMRVALVIFCLPLVAIGPLLRIQFGVGTGPQVTLAALAVYYTTLVPLVVGLRAVPASWLDLVDSYGRSRWTALITVRLRACVPYLAVGLQVAVPGAILGALVGEFTGASRGLGVLTIQTLRGLDTDGLWALATISAAVSVIGYAAVGWAGRRLTSAHPAVLLAPPPTPTAGPSRLLRTVRSGCELVAALAIVLLGWVGLIHFFHLSSFVAKSPGQVWSFLMSSPDASDNRSPIFDALRSTASTVIPGYFAGLAMGLLLAAAFHLSSAVRRVVTPITVALRCIPIVAIAPLLVAALGRGFVGTVVVVALMTFFPTLVACSQGLRQAPGQILDFFASYAAGPLRRLGDAELPAMVPAFFGAARIAVPASILAATVAEWLATGQGIGTLMVNSAINSDFATLWSSVALLTLIAAAGYGLVSIIERVVLTRVAPEQVAW